MSQTHMVASSRKSNYQDDAKYASSRMLLPRVSHMKTRLKVGFLDELAAALHPRIAMVSGLPILADFALRIGQRDLA